MASVNAASASCSSSLASASTRSAASASTPSTPAVDSAAIVAEPPPGVRRAPPRLPAGHERERRRGRQPRHAGPARPRTLPPRGGVSLGQPAAGPASPRQPLPCWRLHPARSWRAVRAAARPRCGATGVPAGGGSSARAAARRRVRSSASARHASQRVQVRANGPRRPGSAEPSMRSPMSVRSRRSAWVPVSAFRGFAFRPAGPAAASGPCAPGIWTCRSRCRGRSPPRDVRALRRRAARTPRGSRPAAARSRGSRSIRLMAAGTTGSTVAGSAASSSSIGSVVRAILTGGRAGGRDSGSRPARCSRVPRLASPRKPPKLAMRQQEDLLQQVLGLLGEPRHAREEAEQAGAVRPLQFLERCGVAVQTAARQFDVGPLSTPEALDGGAWGGVARSRAWISAWPGRRPAEVPEAADAGFAHLHRLPDAAARASRAGHSPNPPRAPPAPDDAVAGDTAGRGTHASRVPTARRATRAVLWP